MWGDQLNPHDLYDYDEINENLLLDLPIAGKATHVLVHPGRDGFMFVIDRQTGQIYSADKYDTQTSMSSFDIKKGAPGDGRCAKARARQEHRRHLPGVARREGLAAGCLFAA